MSKSPKWRKTLWKNRNVIPSVVMDFLVGQRIILLVRPWSTTTRRESKDEEMERSMMRSQEICWKGWVQENLIGVRGGMMG